jgi:hypothetical protein
MKKLVLISAIAMSGLFYNTANAQVRLHFGFHISAPRVFIPARVVVSQPAPVAYAEPANYNGDDDYYYLPDVDAYYSVNEGCYYYMDGNQWVSAAYLPGAYRDFDWRSARRFEVRAPRPFMHDDYYRSKFNGVAFNGRWNDRNNYNARVADHRFDNHAQFNRDDHRFDNDRRNDRNERGRQGRS